jgi:sulfatase maturation enzyme AslB (radical SAM superfamily)
MYNQIDIIEFDINTTCNAFCPSCARHVVYDNELMRNPFVKFNESLPKEIIEKVMQCELLSEDVGIDFVGLLGEPVAHNDILEIIDIVFHYRPNAFINLHTNGGLRTKNFFKELASKFPKHNESIVKFSIDGLKDTNHLYRRGVIWEKVMENIKTFVDAGGKAQWKYIIFPWNEHQVQEAKQLSKEIGLSKFKTTTDRSPKDTAKYIKAADVNYSTKQPIMEVQNVYSTIQRKINDRCFSRKSIYVNVSGHVVPCCMINGGLVDSRFLEETKNFIYNEQYNWNNLENYSLADIMNNSWWQSLYQSFSDQPCTVCNFSCGVN